MTERDFTVKSGLTIANTATITYAGVTLANSVTGTGSMVLSADPTITGNLTITAIKANNALGTTGQALLANSTGGAFWGTATAGANTQVQFNDSGTANATSGLTFDKSSNIVYIANSLGIANTTPSHRLSVAGFISSLGYIDTVTNIGNTGTAANLSITNGGVFTATLTANCTFALQNPSSSGSTSFVLVLTNDATPSRTVAFSGGSFKYPGGSVTRTTAANAKDVWFFMTHDAGTTWYVSIPMSNLS